MHAKPGLRAVFSACTIYRPASVITDVRRVRKIGNTMRLHIDLSRHSAILASVLLITLVGCDAMLRTATREAKPLTYVGQVQLGKPTTNEGGRVVVPLKYNGGEWGGNSAIVPVDVKAAVKDADINITVVTSVATNSNDKDGYEFVLPKHTTGKYDVFYCDPDGTKHDIGELEITD